MPKRSSKPTSVEFQILLSLLASERHGYGIMQDVETLTGGDVRLGPGTLYSSIKRMIARGWLEESDNRPDPGLDDERRRYYRITGLGRRTVREECDRMQRMVSIARQHSFST